MPGSRQERGQSAADTADEARSLSTSASGYDLVLSPVRSPFLTNRAEGGNSKPHQARAKTHKPEARFQKMEPIEWLGRFCTLGAWRIRYPRFPETGAYWEPIVKHDTKSKDRRRKMPGVSDKLDHGAPQTAGGPEAIDAASGLSPTCKLTSAVTFALSSTKSRASPYRSISCACLRTLSEAETSSCGAKSLQPCETSS